MEITIDNKPCTCEKGESILAVARRNGIVIPTLCHHDGLCAQGVCRVCMVEIVEKDWSRLVAACIFPIQQAIEVFTDSETVKKHRSTLISLLLAKAPGNEQISALAMQYGANNVRRFEANNGDACIVCGLCVKACAEIGLSCIGTVSRGVSKKVAAPFEEPPQGCVGCGACAHVCPTGHIQLEENGGTRSIWGKEFTLLRCSVCGRYSMTKEQYAYIQAKTGVNGPPVCDSCQRQAIAEKWQKNTKYLYD